MLLKHSLSRKLVATTIALVAFVLVYEATVIDPSSLMGALAHAAPAPGMRVDFTATAYCKGQTTASGVNVRAGIAAADPSLLPQGSVIQVDGESVPVPFRGIYTVLDTGPKIQGRLIDLYVWSCYEALDFGRRKVSLTILRHGWHPKDSAPSLR
jgi:3D (Asp-Asp-Asp) domain-containing protein